MTTPMYTKLSILVDQGYNQAVVTVVLPIPAQLVNDPDELLGR
jgi:hypothetical protein